MEKASILIPVYNRCELVKSAIDSAIAQTYQNTEIIICDNCSTDTTWEVVQQYADKHKNIIARRNPENLGPVRNWMRCLDLASGTYGTFLYSDDTLDKNFVELTMKQMSPNVAFVGTGYNIVKSNGQTLTPQFSAWPNETNSHKYIMDKTIYGRWNFPVTPVCALFRIKDIKSHLLLDIPSPTNLDYPRFGAGNDVLIYLLTAKQYPKVRFIKKALAHLAHHEGSLSIANRLYPYYFWAYEFFYTEHYNDHTAKWHAYNAIRNKFSPTLKNALAPETCIPKSSIVEQISLAARFPLGRFLSL
jgi:glycosyltransferase involved in cell wall biosynthesis